MWPSVELYGIDYDVLISFRQGEDGMSRANFAVWQKDREPTYEGGFSSHVLDADDLARLLRMWQQARKEQQNREVHL